ncbi:MAG: OmpA family protein, partial [Acidobacteriota bacterium]|nr:OmpA family protein [Acidobacteriota bacterium]
VMTLEENYWSGLRVSSFNEANASKLDELGRLLAQTADYDIKIESHTDDRGEADELEILTKERAQAIEDKLMSLGVPASRMESKGYGATVPVASNATRANRAKNRRVQIILVPNIN